jgi:type I restriction enzyme S subunit
VSEAAEKPLPQGWLRITLGEIALPTRPRCSPAEFPNLPFIGMENVEAHSMRLLGTVPAGTMKSNAVHCQPGDVLYGRLRPYLNKVHVTVSEAMCSAEFIVFPGDTPINAVWLAYRLNSSDFVFFASHLPTGDRPRVDFDQIAQFEVLLAPRAEQDRIVAEIDKQLTRLDAAVVALKRVQANLKRYRAAVLKAACEGRLVPTEAELARKDRRSYETGAELLARILQDRRAKWEAAQLARMTAAGKPPKDKSWKRKYKEPEPPDTNNLPPLPEGWAWATVEQVSSLVQYGSSAKTIEGAGVAVLRMGNILTDGSLATSDLKYLPPQHDEFPSLLLEPGDILFNRTNSAELVGKTAVYKGAPSPCSFASYLIRVRLLPNCSPDYLAACLNSGFGRAWIKTVVNQQVGQANVNGSKLQAFVYPLPPAAEEGRIVAEVERQLSEITAIQQLCEANAARSERLRQSILKRAFEGKLVPQDPNDEPASVLLERIRAARAAQCAADRQPARRKARRAAVTIS